MDSPIDLHNSETRYSFYPRLYDRKIHPLRGAPFETMILSELIKIRFNHGMTNNLLFYRDSNGNEVDVVIPHGAGNTAVEIKAASTITSSFFKGLNRFEAILSEPVQKVLVHSGDTTRKQSGIQITNLRSMEEDITFP